MPPSILSSAYRNRYFTQPISLSILTWIPNANQDLLKFPALAGAMNVLFNSAKKEISTILEMIYFDIPKDVRIIF